MNFSFASIFLVIKYSEKEIIKENLSIYLLEYKFWNELRRTRRWRAVYLAREDEQFLRKA